MPLDYGGRRRQTPQDGDRSAEDIYESGPGGGGTTSSGDEERKPLGVPKDYTAAVGRMWTPSPGRSGRVNLDALHYVAQQGPRYFTGDELRPAQLPGGAESIRELQRQLFEAGYLEGSFAYGRWDAASQKAYKRLLEEANAAGITAEMMLNKAMRDSVTLGSGGEGGGGNIVGFDEDGNPIFEQFQAPALEMQLPNKKELESVVRQSVIDQLGVGWSQQEVSRVADTIIAQYREIQTDAYNQQVQNLEAEFYGQPMPNPVIESVDVPDPQMFVEEEARRRDPAGAQATDIAEDFAPAFFEALGGYT